MCQISFQGLKNCKAIHSTYEKCWTNIVFDKPRRFHFKWTVRSSPTKVLRTRHFNCDIYFNQFYFPYLLYLQFQILYKAFFYFYFSMNRRITYVIQKFVYKNIRVLICEQFFCIISRIFLSHPVYLKFLCFPSTMTIKTTFTTSAITFSNGKLVKNFSLLKMGNKTFYWIHPVPAVNGCRRPAFIYRFQYNGWLIHNLESFEFSQETENFLDCEK